MVGTTKDVPNDLRKDILTLPAATACHILTGHEDRDRVHLSTRRVNNNNQTLTPVN